MIAKVLVVDDERSIRLTVREFLRDADYEVSVAKDADEAMKLLMAADFDVVLADILLPRTTGLELLKTIKEMSPRVQVILMTGEPTVETASEAVRTGAFEYLSKPFGKEQLLRTVSSAAKVKALDEERQRLAEDNLRYQEDLERLVDERTAALRENQEQMELVLRGADLGTWDVNVQTGRIAFNERSASMLGYTPEEIGPRVSTWRELTHPDDSWAVRNTWNAHLLGKVDFFQIEHRLRHKSGRWVWILDRGQVIERDADDKPLRACGTLLDISERKRAEAERRRLILAIEQVAETILITDTEAAIEYVNPAFEQVTGYTREEVVGKNPRFLKSDEQDPASYREMWETVTLGKTWKGRFVNKKKDGTHFTENVSISPVFDAHGTVINYVAVKRDITEELRIEREKAELEQHHNETQRMESIGRLAGGVAHDFNNLLTVIISCIDLTVTDLRRGDPVRNDLEQALEAATSAAGLTRQLLAFGRRQVMSREVIDLNDIVTGLEKMLIRVIGEDIDLRTALATDLGRVMADAGQIEQVLMNLVINARDSMIPAGGKLTIKTANVSLKKNSAGRPPNSNTGPYVMLAVTDAGSGINAEDMKRIFDPFFTTKEKDRGFGLGLASVHGIVKQSEGSIEVRSEPGRGTTFKVYLPLVDAEKPNDLQRIEPIRAPGGETIILVEDEVGVRQLVSRTLTSAGYKVLAASNGREALQLCERYEGDVHLLLTDVVMPEMGGMELADRVAKIYPNARVLFISGYSEDAIEHHGIYGESAQLLAKPFRSAQLTAKVRTALDSD